MVLHRSCEGFAVCVCRVFAGLCKVLQWFCLVVLWFCLILLGFAFAWFCKVCLVLLGFCWVSLGFAEVLLLGFGMVLLGFGGFPSSSAMGQGPWHMLRRPCPWRRAKSQPGYIKECKRVCGTGKSKHCCTPTQKQIVGGLPGDVGGLPAGIGVIVFFCVMFGLLWTLVEAENYRH